MIQNQLNHALVKRVAFSHSAVHGSHPLEVSRSPITPG
jgi:hypothetical protein